MLSNDIFSLNYLLKLTSTFCSKYQVELCAEKTYLQRFTPRQCEPLCHDGQTNPIEINGTRIPFSNSAEHVGILRSSEGNGPSIAARFTAHRRALLGVMQAGLAVRHQGNPTFSLWIEKLYATPVLLSGLSALVLTKAEIKSIDAHYTNTLLRLLRLHDKTPRSVVHFLAGSLPASALLHMRQMGLFSMICRLDSRNLLYVCANEIFTNDQCHRSSWFRQIYNICDLYSLPEPHSIFNSPPPKNQLKLIVRKKVISHWEKILRDEAISLPSLGFFKPQFMSLTRPHPLYISAGSSKHRILLASLQAKMLSGRYRSEALLRHWKPGSNGNCLLTPSCNVLEDIPHLLQHCPAYDTTRCNLLDFTEKVVSQLPEEVAENIRSLCQTSSPLFCDFLLDCSSLPTIISAVQKYGVDLLHKIFYLTQSWIFNIHNERLKLRQLLWASHN